MTTCLLVGIDSVNNMAPVQRLARPWIRADLLSIGPITAKVNDT